MGALGRLEDRSTLSQRVVHNDMIERRDFRGIIPHGINRFDEWATRVRNLDNKLKFVTASVANSPLLLYL